eukprot:294959-Pyramimonas_sp.AAC.1
MSDSVLVNVVPRRRRRREEGGGWMEEGGWWREEGVTLEHSVVTSAWGTLAPQTSLCFPAEGLQEEDEEEE